MGNTTSYSYTDTDSDGDLELTGIADAAGRTTTLAYAGGRLSQVTDFAGRTTTLTHDGGGRLTSVAFPDPDGTGPQAVRQH